MKTRMLVATCLVLGSSSAAMADSSGAVRDHRSPYGDTRVAPAAPIAPVRFTHPIAFPTTHTRHPGYPATYPAAYPVAYPVSYPVTYPASYPATYPAPYRIERPIVALPAVTGPTWDCQNWDPTVETSSVCAAFDAGRPAPALAPVGGGILLGVRDAAIPDHQYITADGQAFRELVIEGNECAPAISRVAVKFTDGSVQTVNVDGRLREGDAIAFNLDGGYRRVNQIVLYTPHGATGSYAVLGR